MHTINNSWILIIHFVVQVGKCYISKSHIPQIIQNSVIILILQTLDASTQNVKNIQDVKPHTRIYQCTDSVGFWKLHIVQRCTHGLKETRVNGVTVQLMQLLNPGNNYAFALKPSPLSVCSPKSPHKASSVWTLDSCPSSGKVAGIPRGEHDLSVCPPACPSLLTAYFHYLVTTGCKRKTHERMGWLHDLWEVLQLCGLTQNVQLWAACDYQCLLESVN